GPQACPNTAPSPVADTHSLRPCWRAHIREIQAESHGKQKAERPDPATRPRPKLRSWNWQMKIAARLQSPQAFSHALYFSSRANAPTKARANRLSPEVQCGQRKNRRAWDAPAARSR